MSNPPSITDRIQIEQGLKPSKNAKQALEDRITDRIQIEQGLKLNQQNDICAGCDITDRIQIEQGLKLYIWAHSSPPLLSQTESR